MSHSAHVLLHVNTHYRLNSFFLSKFQSSGILDTLIRNTHRTFTDIREKKIQLRQFYNFIISKILRRYYFFLSPLEDVFIGDNMSIPGSHNGQLVIITLDDKCAWAYMCMCVCVWVKIAWNTITTLTKDQCLVKSWRVHAYTTVIILDHFLFLYYFILL